MPAYTQQQHLCTVAQYTHETRDIKFRTYETARYRQVHIFLYSIEP